MVTINVSVIQQEPGKKGRDQVPRNWAIQIALIAQIITVKYFHYYTANKVSCPQNVIYNYSIINDWLIEKFNKDQNPNFLGYETYV